MRVVGPVNVVHYEVSGLRVAELGICVYNPIGMQRVVHLDKLFQMHEVQRTLVSHVKCVLRRHRRTCVKKSGGLKIKAVNDPKQNLF